MDESSTFRVAPDDSDNTCTGIRIGLGALLLSRLEQALQRYSSLSRERRRRFRRKLAKAVVGVAFSLSLVGLSALTTQTAGSGPLLNIGADRPALTALNQQNLGLQQSPGTFTQTTLPNIVVITTDDQDAEALFAGDGTCIPSMRQTMAFPEGSWVNFTNAFVTRSLCAPSRASFLTGQYAYRHGVLDNSLWSQLNEQNTLPVWLDQAGYRTGAIGKNRSKTGWDYRVGFSDTAALDEHTALAVRFIENSGAEPFFLSLAYYAPHQPAMPPARYANANVCVPPDRPNFNEADVSDQPYYISKRPLLTGTVLQSLRTERQASLRETLAIDDGVAQVINALKAKGLLDNTLVIVTSDNGYSWGSHRYRGKTCEFAECNKVPLLIRFPGLSGNASVAANVSNVDLTATILDYAGIAPGLPQDGISLLPILTNPGDAGSLPDRTVFLENPANNRYYGIVNSAWKYVERLEGVRQLYDLTADPYEMTNVADRPAYQAIQSQLATLLATMKPPAGPAKATPTPGGGTPAPTSTPVPTATATATLVPPGSLAFISPTGSGTIAGMAYTGADILVHNRSTGAWDVYYDGSNVKTPKNVGALSFLGGDLILGFSAAQSISGVGTSNPQDLVRFSPARIGYNNTAGTFSWHFDGSDVGLSTSGETIDALWIDAQGRLYFSTIGSGEVPVNSANPGGAKIRFQDEDILRFTPSTTGETTAGTWELYWDPTGLPGMSGEDINGYWEDPDTGHRFVTILGSFSVGATGYGKQTGNGKTILRFTPNAAAPGGWAPVEKPAWLAPGATFPSNIDAIDLRQ